MLWCILLCHRVASQRQVRDFYVEVMTRRVLLMRIVFAFYINSSMYIFPALCNFACDFSFFWSEDAESIHNGATSFASWPFLRCMASHDDNPTKAESCFEQSMNGSGLEWSAVRACATSEYDCVVAASVAATPQRNESHLKVLVNGKMITSPGKTLLAEVCKAFKGKAPRSCELE